MKYGERLRALRISKNLTLDEVHEQTGVWKGALSQTENGKTKVSIDLLRRLSVIYGGYNAVISYVLLENKPIESSSI